MAIFGNLYGEKINKEIYMQNRNAIFEWVELLLDEYIARQPQFIEQITKDYFKNFATIESLKGDKYDTEFQYLRNLQKDANR